MKCSFDIEKLRSYIKHGNSSRSPNFYYVPELNSWIPGRKIVKRLRDELSLTPKEWFDKHFLLKDENGNPITPVCEVCGKPLTFFNLTRGYQKRFCCSKCTGESQREDEDFKKAHSIAAKKVWDRENSPYRTKEYSDSISEGLLNLYYNIRCKKDNFRLEPKSDELIRLSRYFRQMAKWADPNSKYNSKEYREKLSQWVKNSPNAFGGKITHTGGSSHSKISEELFNSIRDILVTRYDFDSDDIIYGSTEYRVLLSDEVKSYSNTNNGFYKLDFYIESLNRCIEFNGDFWHKNPFKLKSSEFDEEEYSSKFIGYSDSMISDLDRLTNIAIELEMKDLPLVVWESDYRNDRLGTVFKCVDYVLKGFNFRSKDSIWDIIYNSSEEIMYPFEYYLNNSVYDIK